MHSNQFDDVVATLKDGRAAVFPTDTVYGLGVAVDFATSPQEIFTLKHRDAGKPVAWLVEGASALTDFGCNVPEYALRLASSFWPGPLTLIVRAGESVPSAFQSESGSIGLRMPDNDTVLQLIHAVGCPLATSSANISQRQATARFSDLDTELMLAVQGALSCPDDHCSSGIASTVVDCTGAVPHVVREGSITRGMIDSAC